MWPRLCHTSLYQYICSKLTYISFYSISIKFSHDSENIACHIITNGIPKLTYHTIDIHTFTYGIPNSTPSIYLTYIVFRFRMLMLLIAATLIGPSLNASLNVRIRHVIHYYIWMPGDLPYLRRACVHVYKYVRNQGP